MEGDVRRAGGDGGAPRHLPERYGAATDAVQGADGQPPKYTSALDCYFKVKAAEGWTGLYRGLGITLIRGIPNTGIQFLVYETLKDVLDAYG